MDSSAKTAARVLWRQPRGRQTRQAIVSLVVGLFIYHVALWLVEQRSRSSYKQSDHHQLSFISPQSKPHWSSLCLTEQQCLDSFPGLTQSVDDVVAEGPFQIKDTGDLGPLQGRIKDRKIYIVNAQRRSDLSAEMLNSRTAALHQLHRAIVTSPEPIPDTVFTINFQDSPSSVGASIGYSRAADPQLRGVGVGGQHDSGRRSFLMPHFSFWAWPLRHIAGGTFDEAAAAIDAVEARYDGAWVDKTTTAVWRGTIHFESALQPGLRRGLLRAAAAGGPEGWADVLPLNDTTALPIHDFCRHRYVIHTEGVAYSGRFQLLQMCRSVMLTPPLMWMQHTSHLLKPVFSGELLGRDDGHAVRRGWATTGRTRRSWPVRHPASEANIVFVAPDWSDLAATVAWLEAHPDVAEGIATRQRKLFRGGGYFSPAAEACYWRALVRGWSSVARVDEGVWGGRDGVRLEVFSLKNEL